MIDNVIQLPELHFIAGSRQILEFEVYDDENEPLDISDAMITFIVSDNSKKKIYLTKEITIPKEIITTHNIVSVELKSSETENWAGKYIAQIQIALTKDTIIIPAEMLLCVIEKLKG